MLEEPSSTWLFSLTLLFLIILAAATVLTLRIIWTPERLQLELPYQDVLTGRAFCPKCFSTSLEPTGHHAFRCKNCGFVFGFGNP
jgi:tRNA(Ile2) C34 agmatinyltransferase TiaS